jgi:uncharacterized protein YoxC
MSGQLDQISSEIGGLKANLEYAKHQNESILAKLDKMEDKLARLADVERKIQAMEPILQDYQSFRQRALGVGAAFSIFFTTLGVVVSWFAADIRHFFIKG